MCPPARAGQGACIAYCFVALVTAIPSSHTKADRKLCGPGVELASVNGFWRSTEWDVVSDMIKGYSSGA